MQNTSKSSLRGYLTGVGATVFLSFTGILISYLNKTYNLPSLVLAFWRDCFAVLGLMVAFTLFSRGRFRLDKFSLEVFYFIRPDAGHLQYDVDVLGAVQRRGGGDGIGLQFACHDRHPVAFYSQGRDQPD